METKLTLVLDKAIIERAKLYASSKKTSLSKMIEAYLDRVTEEETAKAEISPLVKSLSGVLSLPKTHDLKKDYGDYLADKYLNG
ncbi:DUF6364 family protein [Nibribacter koreensis]|uniref:Antitoxin VapB n=1 Tax=Nibribacter koreensis TaxID=1084519 RepID=A0ABP8FWP7_9BACT